MDRKKAIEHIKWYFTEDDGIAADASVKEAIQALVPELAESEDERIRKRLIDCLKFSLKGAEEQDAAGCSRQKDIEAYKWGIAYLEKPKEQRNYRKLYEDIAKSEWFKKAYEGKSLGGEDEQKEQKPADDKAFEEWIDDWWKHNRVNNPDSYDKGDEIQFDEQGFKNFCRRIRNMYQQKPAGWGEKDEWMIEELCCLVDSYELEEQKPEKIKFWLKSLRPQPKQEWSEEDKKKLNRIYKIIGYAADDKAFLQSKRILGDKEAIDLQKFLREISRSKPSDNWRPTEEQLNALDLASYGGELPSEDCLELVSLLNDLKKNYSI